IRHQLLECGYKWSARKLCTVRAARKIVPGLRSYSLGNLCQNLDIPIHQRHRAGGDADATTLLLEYLLRRDGVTEWERMVNRASKDQQLRPILPRDDFDRLPQTPGVYYFANQQGQVIYIGKAVNIKKRVASHFSGYNAGRQRQNFLRDIYGIS